MNKTEKNAAEADKDISSLSSVLCYGWGKASSLAYSKGSNLRVKFCPCHWLPAVQLLGFLDCRNKYEQICKPKQALLVVEVSSWSRRGRKKVCSVEAHRMVEFHMCISDFWAAWQPGGAGAGAPSITAVSWAGIPLSQSALQKQRGGIAPLWEISSKISSCPWFHKAPGSVISLEALYTWILFLLILKDMWLYVSLQEKIFKHWEQHERNPVSKQLSLYFYLDFEMAYSNDVLFKTLWFKLVFTENRNLLSLGYEAVGKLKSQFYHTSWCPIQTRERKAWFPSRLVLGTSVLKFTIRTHLLLIQFWHLDDSLLKTIL